MPGKSTNKSQLAPKPQNFKSEAEEADWWTSPDGRRYTAQRFEEKTRKGQIVTTEDASITPKLRERMKQEGVMVQFKNGLKVKRTKPAVIRELMDRMKAKQTQSISIRIPLADLEAAKKLAEKTGLGYQTILKDLIHEGLQRAL